MTPTDTNHPTAEQLAAHALGDADAAVAAHAAGCPACAAALAETIAIDATLSTTFAAARPLGGLEDRLVGAVRSAAAARRRLPVRLPARPAVRRVAIAAAAAAVVIGFGVFGSGDFGTRTERYTAARSRAVEATSAGIRSDRFGFVDGERETSGFVLKNPDATLAVSSDIKPGTRNANDRQHDQDGQNAMYGDGHAEFVSTPFKGQQHDNLNTRLPAAVPPSKPENGAGAGLQVDTGASPNGTADSSLLRVERFDFGFRQNVIDKSPPPFRPSDAGRTDGVHRSVNDRESKVVDMPAANRPAGGDQPQPARQPTVPGLIQTAQEYTEAGRYNDALKVVDGIRQMDPANPYATGVQGFLKDKAAIQAERQYVERRAADSSRQLIDERDGEKQEPRTGIVPAAPAAIDASLPAAGDGPRTAPAVDGRKVIRTGTMEFEVDRFDAAVATLTKVVAEAGGFVATTDSQKLPNGKMRGTITVRVPPERLDLLVLGLRALGDLKAQQVTAQDVTKEYTDVESELTADRAMQARLLDLIQSGKGSIKDLLAAETELGNWRVKIERAEGQIRYYNSQIGLSTLAVTLSERDLQQAAAVIETETADMGVEAADVEHARDAAFKVIEAAKGRVVEAELKRLDAGQLAARIVADVPPEQAGAVIDQMKQLGRVARLEVHRQQTAANVDPATAAAAVRTERRPTRLLLSVYNLANVAPRRTTRLTLAAADPTAAYAAVLALATDGGRVVTSELDHGSAGTGSVELQLPPGKLDAALAVLTAHGEVIVRTTTENADTANTTDAKVGLSVYLMSLANVVPREQTKVRLAAADVPATYRALTAAAAAAGAHLRVATLDEQDRQHVSATLEVDVPRTTAADFDRALAASGEATARSTDRLTQGENAAESKVRVSVALVSADTLPPRETTGLTVEVADADAAAASAQAIAASFGGRVLDAKVSRSPSGPARADVAIDVPLGKAGGAIDELRHLGTVRGVDSARDATAPAGPLAHARITVTLATADAIVGEQNGLAANLRNGLSTGLAGLLASVRVLVVGLSLVVPWVLVAWVAVRLWRRVRRPAKMA